MSAWLREVDERQVCALTSFLKYASALHLIISKLSYRVSLGDEILCTESSSYPRSPWSIPPLPII